MPLKGVTDQRRMTRIGKIHLGIKVPTQDGKGERPKPVEWFEVHEEPSTSAAAAAAFKKVYGDKPTELDIVFPSDDEMIVADANYKAYSQTHGLICKGDGDTARARWDPNQQGMRPTGIDSGTWANRNTKHWDWMDVPCLGPKCPMQLAKKCRAVMNLQFFLPDVDGFGIWQLDVGSRRAMQNILDGMELVKAVTTGRVKGIHLKLRRISVEMTPENDKKKTVYVLDLYSPLNPIAMLQQAKQLEGGMFLLPAPDEAQPDDADEETEPFEEETIEATARPVTTNTDRPDAETHMSNCASFNNEPCDCDRGIEPEDIPFEPEEKVAPAEDDFPPNPPMITQQQREYLFGGGKVPKDKALAPRWITQMGGMEGVIAKVEELHPAIAACVHFTKDGKKMAWAYAITEEQATNLISELKSQLGVKTRAPKEAATV